MYTLSIKFFILANYKEDIVIEILRILRLNALGKIDRVSMYWEKLVVFVTVL